VLHRIVEFFHPQPGDRVVEIGAGRGALTKLLAPTLAPGGRLTALELDARLAAGLRLELTDLPHLSVVEADALKFDFGRSIVGEDGTPPTRIRVVGNLPYYAATAILLRLMDNRENIQDIVVMLQKEVAERIAAAPGSKNYGTLSLALQVWCEVERGFEVGPQAFRPPPKVSSRVIRLVPQAHPRVPLDNPAFFERTVRTAFAQRRKTLLNNLKAGFHEGAYAARIVGALHDCGIDPVRRAETLSLEEFARLANELARGIKN
jgi:16S rRNA (adenine1518-N6/adenine1519-N6)-dimethyltransferase